jgi:Tfp pilus assembly protein FimT
MSRRNGTDDRSYPVAEILMVMVILGLLAGIVAAL